MSPIEIRLILRRQPFMPCRIHMSDGRTFDVKHPDAAATTKNAIYLVIDFDPTSGDVTEREVLGMLHVTAVTQYRSLEGLAAAHA